MVSFSRAMKRMVGVRSGRIAQLWDYNTGSSFIAPCTTHDINGDSREEIILATKDGEVIILDSNGQEQWRYSIHETVGNVEEMFMDSDSINSINSQPSVGVLNQKTSICFGSELGVVYCLDKEGNLQWKYEADGGVRGSVLLADVNGDGKLEVVFGALDKHLYILNEHGKLIERFEQADAIESTPGFFGGSIVFGTNDGKIVSITAEGKNNWEFETGAQVTSEPVFGRLTTQPVDVVVIGSTDNIVYCLDIDGELVWSYETKGAIYSKAVIFDVNKDGKQEVVVGSCDNNVHVITHEGEKLWSYETDFWVVGTPIIADIDGDGKPEIIIGSYDHNVYVLDSEGSYELDYIPGLSGVVQQPGHYSDIMTSEPGSRIGKKIWQYKTPGPIIGCSVKQNELIVTTKKGIIDSLQHKT